MVAHGKIRHFRPEKRACKMMATKSLANAERIPKAYGARKDSRPLLLPMVMPDRVTKAHSFWLMFHYPAAMPSSWAMIWTSVKCFS